MYEELYIIKDNERVKLDLNSPSGITLNFKSNILGDLSKITCSYSYTFKLPLTLNNRLALDNADDIRAKSNMVRRRLKAEFCQNGISLFNNANLYIDSTESCFNAVMTWNVIDGMQALKDNDISLRELPLTYDDVRDKEAFPIFGGGFTPFGDYDNNIDYLTPYYDAGLPYFWKIEDWSIEDWPTCRVPLPVVPVYRLIQRINKHFGTTFKFGPRYSSDTDWYKAYGWEANGVSDIINRGVIPLVNAEQNEDLVEYNKINVGIFTFGGGSVQYCGVNNCLKFPYAPTDEITSFSIVDNTAVSVMKVLYKGGLEFELDGIIRVELKGTSSSDKPTFKVYEKNWNKNSATEVCSIEGVYDYSTAQWVFDFRTYNGKDRLTFQYYVLREGVGTDSKEATFFFALSHEISAIRNCNLSIYRKYVTSEISIVSFFDSDNVNAQYPIDVTTNLPDIGCLDFIKSLFYIIGAAPIVNDLGDIVPMYFESIKQNLDNDKTLDWSDKITSDYKTLPSKIVYAIPDYAQDNIYLTKGDDADGKENTNVDVYSSGRGDLYVQNEVIDQKKTIIQVPFYAPYVKDKNHPFQDVGGMRFWFLEKDGTLNCGEAKPCLGIVDRYEHKNWNGEVVETILKMEFWKGFSNLTSNSNYAYLQSIFNDPVIITETLNLNELDIRDIDYSVPIYINKYNAYFAIVTIQRDANGKCKCELLKLP